MGAGARMFLVGFAGVLAGLLVGTQLRDDPPAARADMRARELDRKLERFEGIVRELTARSNGREAGAPDATVAVEELPGTAQSLQAEREPPETLFVRAAKPTSRDRLGELGGEMSRAFAEGAHLVFYGRVRERYLLRTCAEILDEFGRPDDVTLDAGVPAFGYRFTVPDSDLRATLTFGFADGHVFRADVRTYRVSGVR